MDGLFASLGGLAEADTDALAAALSDADATGLRGLARALRGRTGAAARAAAWPALEAWWDAGLERRLQEALLRWIGD